MKWFAIVLILLSNQVNGAEINTATELLRLPAYCRGVMGSTRLVSGDTTPIEKYVAIYGEAYNHMHHYCFALNTENEAGRLTDLGLARGKLQYALKDIDYVLSANRDPHFVFLPEIYRSKARILFKLDRPLDAVACLEKSIQAGPGFAPAYTRLSDYYAEIGNTQEAIRILREGLSHSKRPDFLKRRLNELEAKNSTNDASNDGNRSSADQ